MTIRPTIGQVPPVNETYAADEMARLFWRLSYRAGRGYVGGKDATGGPVLIEHEREEKSSYERRRRTVKPRGFVGPILRRYLGVVFRRPPVRPADAPPIYQEVVNDATGGGVPLDQFMALALARAQVDRESYIVPDVKADGALPASPNVAQLQAAKARPVLNLMDAPCVLNWRDAGGTLAEILYVWRNAAGVEVLRYMNATEYQDFTVEARPPSVGIGLAKVTGATPAKPHGYGMMPVTRLRPVFDPHGALADGTAGDSQAAPLAESQQAIVNLLSLLNEEIYNVTFSQMIASGVDKSDVGEVKVGNNRVLCLPNPASRVDFIGADPAQAASIRASLDDERVNVYQAAGLSPGDPSAAVSGVALAWRASDMGNIVKALSLATQAAENRMWAVLASGWGFTAPAPTQYHADADLPDFQAEVEAMVGIVSNAAMPAVIRRKVAERFAARNLSLNDKESKALADSIQDKPSGPASASPFPPRRPAPAAMAAEAEDDDEDEEGEGGEEGAGGT